ncbi:hypothetical protein [uncultured Rummeliibacillus sp.]|uniref:hypothetical protein n=1 Tax=uncultured Rummeliibacillus sp. TaxID=762292 RepID=UPI00260A2489|nr:hypothetical protein [uncultured Rummeliibacillus sp.]
MGFAKNMQIEKDEHERECIESGSTVWVDWETSSYHCEKCEETFEVKQCINDHNLISKDSEDFLCSYCIDYMKRD